MKVDKFGKESAPVILLLPGTCCHWKGNFGHVIPLLETDFRVLCVSYDGFDETERTEFPTMTEETEKMEDYIQKHCGGRIRAAYGCSLGGSFVGLLTAGLQTKLLLPLIYPVIRDGGFKSRFLQRRPASARRFRIPSLPDRKWCIATACCRALEIAALLKK